jgi:ABC-type branched-subunit amino acid transport system ATPase component
MALISAIARERGLAVLFTEHDMDVVFSVAIASWCSIRGG